MSHRAPDAPDPETALLLSYLDGQRRHVFDILDGLDAAALRRPVLPSGWSCLGLVRHLALDDERFWFGAVVAGDREVIDGLSDDAWQVPDDMPAQAVLDLYRAEIARSNAVLAATPLDAPLAWWPREQFGRCWMDDVREVVLHVMTETACHAGHLDAVRELIDGRQRLVVP